jgi:hypothetical protein
MKLQQLIVYLILCLSLCFSLIPAHASDSKPTTSIILDEIDFHAINNKDASQMQLLQLFAQIIQQVEPQPLDSPQNAKDNMSIISNLLKQAADISPDSCQKIYLENLASTLPIRNYFHSIADFDSASLVPYNIILKRGSFYQQLFLTQFNYLMNALVQMPDWNISETNEADRVINNTEKNRLWDVFLFTPDINSTTFARHLAMNINIFQSSLPLKMNYPLGFTSHHPSILIADCWYSTSPHHFELVFPAIQMRSPLVNPTIIIFKNVLNAHCKCVLEPILASVTRNIKNNDYGLGHLLFHIFHRLAHYIGPVVFQINSTPPTTIQQDMGEYFLLTEEIKADLLTINFRNSLIANGFISSLQAEQMLEIYIAMLLYEINSDETKTSSLSAAIQCQFYLEQGIIVYHPKSDRFSINKDKLDKALRKFIRQLLRIMQKGDQASMAKMVEKSKLQSPAFKILQKKAAPWSVANQINYLKTDSQLNQK